VIAAFLNALASPAGPDRAALALLVTPESLPTWGDFTNAAALVGDCGMTTRANSSDTGRTWCACSPSPWCCCRR